MNRSELREELIRLILGSDVELTGEQVAEFADVEYEEARRLWRALGFPDVAGSVAFTNADVAALGAVRGAIDQGIFDEQSVYRITRALGRMMSRLAEWQVEALVEQVERDVAKGTAETRLERAVELAQVAAPGFEQVMLYAWRRHLAAAAARIEALGVTDDEVLSSYLCVGFVDLSRFTSLSNDLDEGALGDLVEGFEDVCTDVVTADGGRVVKTLGDAVLFVAETPADGARIGLDLIAAVGANDDLPNVKVGLATGTVLSRMGDVFGPPVNLAARLTAVARSNRLLVDETTAGALGDDFEQRTLPPRVLRGFGEVSPVTVSGRHTFRSAPTHPV